MAGNKEEATLLLRVKETGKDILDRVVITLGDIIGIAKAVGEAFVDIFKESLSAYADQEKAINSLNQGLIQQGIYSRDLSEAYQTMASNLERVTGIQDEEILNSTRILQAQLGEIEVTEGLQKAVLDLAAAKGMDLASASELVAKTIGTSTNALARQGIEVDATATKQEKLAQVIGQVNSKFGGQAEVATQGLGVFKLLQVSFSNLYEALGERLAPAFTVIGQELNKFLSNANNTKPVIDFIVGGFSFLVKIVDTTVLAFKNLGVSIGAVLGSSVAAFQSLLQGEFAKAKMIMVDGSKAAEVEVEANRTAHNERMIALDQALTGNKEAVRLQDEENQRASNARKRQMEMEASALRSEDFNIEKTQELIKQNEFELVKNDQTLRNQLAVINAKLANETSAVEKLALLRQKEQAIEAANNRAKAEGATAYLKLKQYLASEEGQAVSNSLNQIATLQHAKSKELVAVGKAAAIAQAIANTALAVTQALGSIPFPFNFAAATAVGVAGAVQIAKISGVELAQGGIVKSRPGGIQATIGEGGQDEAVIPLDRAGGFGGGSVVVNFNGPMMGDPSQAREIAVAIDRELFKLRRDGESVSFDSRVS